jgi:hypothetical protein
MAVGDILKESGLVVENFTINTSQDIVKGSLYVDNGTGLIPATAALAAVSKVVMALETRVYATDTTNGHPHTVPCVVRGFVVAAKVSGSGLAYKLQRLMISATAGAVTKFVVGDTTGTANQSTINAAALVNLNVVGYATKISTDAEVVQEMFLGA